MKKHGLKALGICVVAALGVLAFSAAFAQAAPPNWMVNGGEATGTLEVTGKAETDFLLLVQASNVEILCETFEVDDGLLFVGGTSLAVLLFKKGCVARSISPLATLPCTVGEPIEAKVKDKLVLVGSPAKAYDLFEPDVSGAPFTTIHFGGAECPLPEEVPITGSALVEDCNNALETEAKTHLIQQAPESVSGTSDVLKFGKNPARLDGSAILELLGAHAGQNWSGLAG